MKGLHIIQVPRFEQDILSGLRTLVHFTALNGMNASLCQDGFELSDMASAPPMKVNESVAFVRSETAAEGVRAIVIEVDKVRLGDIGEEDLRKLNCTRQEYEERWNSLHPDAPMESNPEVWRVEVVYAGIEVAGHVLCFAPENVPGGSNVSEFRHFSEGPWRCNLCGERFRMLGEAKRLPDCTGWKGNRRA